ncbi:hypothetical protein ACF05T_34320 [Streptomyces lateritius]|uniref:Replication-associated protein ORF2/G2P domain-containing protein n=1 Tax=Streptomyces lateritius TaxID=67313 RepID=A0ABW6YMI1_9ACTN
MSAAIGMWTRRESWGGAVTPTGEAPLNAYGSGLRPATGRRRRVGEEGPRPIFAVSPGTVAIAWPDVSRAERTAERQAEAAHKAAQDLGRYLAEYVGDPAEPDPTRVISAWSAKSRARMTRTLAELDYRPLLRMGLRLPMTTLTYPGDWLTVAPTGRAVKRHMDQWRKRFERAWAFPFVGIWKLEFQRRGAPHIHLWGPEPEGRAGEVRRLTATRYRPAVGDGLTYRQWLSVVWADVVAHPDPEQKRRHLLAGTAVDFREGERMRDPRRLAIYFTKHGSYAAKEYQHEVPEEWQKPGAGPGRFWGYWGLETAAVAVEIDPAAAVWAARLLRRYARSQGTTRQVTVRRVDTRTGTIRYRKSRVRAERMRGGRGFLCVNDGPALASQLARAVDRLDWTPVAPLPAPRDQSRPEPTYPTCESCGQRLDPRLAEAGGRHLGC